MGVSEGYKRVEMRKRELGVFLDRVRGSIFGGAVGDALGYPVEFMDENQIKEVYGPEGISQYEIDRFEGKALISDDTQMTLFTANGLLIGETRMCMRGIGGRRAGYVAYSYQDWLLTQTETYDEYIDSGRKHHSAWLNDVPELYARRAPGITCLSALQQRKAEERTGTYIQETINDSKGCGGIMRVAPMAMMKTDNIEFLDKEGAEIAAITHSHPLGFMPAAMLVHIINRLVYSPEMPLIKVIEEARDAIAKLFEGYEYIHELVELVNLAIDLSNNKDDDLDNIHTLGQGFVAEETLAIAIYCSLKYKEDFSKGIAVSVNHEGDSDSTGAVTGNILGAVCGYSAIEDKWKNNLELADLIIEMADDLCFGCQISEYSDYEDEAWRTKYIKGELYNPTEYIPTSPVSEE